ncbi:hypothetical protein FQN60_015510, partial [Etheostoma spectabile]
GVSCRRFRHQDPPLSVLCLSPSLFHLLSFTPLILPDVNAKISKSEATAPPAACSSSEHSDPMEEFTSRLQDILSTHGSAADLLDTQSLNKLSSPEQKLEDVVRKYAEVAALRRSDEKKMYVLQQRLSVLLDERQQLQEESRSNITARCKLETLCKELQGHYAVLREENLQRSREDEEKRTEITDHFQRTLTEIQAQIEQHSSRNDKLCHENSSLTDKLESLMSQEAIDKTKKCFAMKEQELAMKKKLLVQAAEWKLQTQTLREQGTMMQAQLKLYGEKFDEFQATLAKSNEIYVRFKKEMDKVGGDYRVNLVGGNEDVGSLIEMMSEKMKKMDKESNLWRTRFENCNKALTEMMEERTMKMKEYDVFVLKIQKLERLCNALQSERAILYEKIKEIRQTNSNIPSKVFGSSKVDELLNPENPDKSAMLTPVDLQELQELQKEDSVLTEGMSRLKEEQAKLQEIAASLLAKPCDNDEEDNDDVDTEEDLMSSAFAQFKTKAQVKEEAVSVPQQVADVKSEAAESVLPQPDKVEEVSKPALSTPVENTSDMIPTDTKPEAVKVQTQVEEKEVKPDEAIQQPPAEPAPTSEPEKVKIDPPTNPEGAEAEILVKAAELNPVVPLEDEKVQAKQVKVPEEAPTKSESAPLSKDTPKATASSNADSSKKQTPKKKKKKNGKNAS